MGTLMQAVRFGVNGVLATAIHYLVLTLLYPGILESAGIANGMGSLFGIASSYLGNRFFVFHEPNLRGGTVHRFLLLYSAIAAFHVAFMFAWQDVLGLGKTGGFFTAVVIATLLSFIGNKFLVFRRQSHEASDVKNP